MLSLIPSLGLKTVDRIKLQYDILCVRCGTDITRIRYHTHNNGKTIGYEDWYHNENGNPVCFDCWDLFHKKRTILFLGVQIYLSWNPRTGRCSKCTNNIHDGSCKVTNMHHLFYLRICPWFGMVELCVSCHAVETVNRPLIRNQFGVFPRRT